MVNNKQSFLDLLLNDSSFINWAKECNQNDMEFWTTWIKNNPNKAEEVYNAKSIITGITFKKEPITQEKIDLELQTVLRLIEKKEQERNEVIPLKRNFFRKTKNWIYACSAAAAILLFFIFSNGITQINSSETIHKTGFGEIIDLKLPDGTSVVLNGNSEIKYSKGNPRNIELKGEAYFKVKPIPSTKAKFWVNTKDLRVEVYGTQFHVNTRKMKTDVLLDEGSVHLILDNGRTKEMVPGELVSFSKAHNAISHEKVTKELSYSIWRDGTYVFNNTSLEEVMINLKQAYGVNIEFNDEKLKKLVLTGGIPNQNLKICLSAIEKSTGTKIVQKDNTLKLFKNQ